MRSFNLAYRFALLLLILHGQAFAQSHTSRVYAEYATPPEVTEDGKPKSLAWVGGMNNPQFAKADLNKDGIPDITIFEEDNGVRTLLNMSSIAGNPNYVNKPDYANNFPWLIKYMKMLDFNRDAIPDLFDRGYFGCQARIGYYNSQNQLCFKKGQDIRFNYTSTMSTYVYVSPIEIPNLLDMDGDGDIDFFSFDQITGTVIDYYKNCQNERGLSKDTMVMCMNDRCWGRMQDNGQKKWALGFGCIQTGITACKSTKTTDPGNNTCMFDYDGDGDIDFFNASNVWSDVQLFINGKNIYGRDSIISEDTLWGSNGKTLKLPVWPLAHSIDIDNDKDNDLIFAPKAQNTENYKNVVYYKNTGTATAPNYVYQSDSFLVSDMIDKGTGSTPVLYDYNKDGKVDLFIGCEGYYQQTDGSLRTSISYYENVSTGTQIKFDLVTRDFLGLYAGKTKGSAMAMGDIDGDGKDDLLIGKTDGTIMYYQNMAVSATVTPVWQFKSALNDLAGTLDVGDYAMPCIYDINKDGKKDIVVGCQSGGIYYYKNVGPGSGLPPAFDKITDRLGDIYLQEKTFYTYTAPFIGKIDNTGKEYLLIGSKAGILYRYDSIASGKMITYPRLDSNYSFINVFNQAAPTVADIDNDGIYDMVVGSILGGVQIYKQYFPASVQETVFDDHSIEVYPNPANNVVHVTWKDGFASEEVSISLISVTGQHVWSGKAAMNSKEIEINTSSLTPGLYYCILHSGGQIAKACISIAR